MHGLPTRVKKHLLTYCYFCPAAEHRPGGVQQVVGPLLDGLRRSGHWDVTIAHPGDCDDQTTHQVVTAPGVPGFPDQIDPDRFGALARRVHSLEKDADVLLSIDRTVPVGGRTPRVLMSNTTAYVTEASAIAAGDWTAVVVPSRHFARRVRPILAPDSDVTVVPYGLAPSIIERATNLVRPCWHRPNLVVSLPHRPDPRKGHAAAIEGLARETPHGRSIQLDIAWLDEPRYTDFRRQLEGLAAYYGVSERVRFRPWANATARWSTLEAAHAVIQVGGFEETFGLAAIEAVLAGRIAITGAQPALREVARGPLHLEVAATVNWCQALEQATRNMAGMGPADTSELAASLSLDRMVASYHNVLSNAASPRNR